MMETNQYVEALLTKHNISIDVKKRPVFDDFVSLKDTNDAVDKIKEIQNSMLEKYRIINRIDDIKSQTLSLPNGTVNKPFVAKIDFIKLGWTDIVYSEIIGLDDVGLAYDNNDESLTGIPSISGDIKVRFLFRIKGEDESSNLNEKTIPLIINPDPKSLWKDIPSDVDKDEEWKVKNYWKPDTEVDKSPLGGKNIVAVSKRGRSHATVGSFRDDHFTIKEFKSGWNIVCVADGAGSAKYSREGSRLVCEEIVNYFETNFSEDTLLEFDTTINEFNEASKKKGASPQVNETSEGLKSNSPEKEIKNKTEPPVDINKKLNLLLYNNLGKAAFSAHKKVLEYAKEKEAQLKDFHSTLIFTLFKKYDFGYAILTFGVGDCPIGLLNKDKSEIHLMNWLDVGEFGGGTRFITMPEIFSSPKFSSRFNFKIINDFSYLILMTDGVYDPKFVVEANLEKTEKWNEFLADLNGDNDENLIVQFDKENKEITEQLSKWMDFWSPGNHDDRTLAIIF